MAELGRCTSCHAIVLWGLTAARRRRMPLDRDPSSLGNAWFDRDGLVHVLSRQALLFGDEDLPAVRYVPHYATCPSYRRDPQGARERTEAAVLAEREAAVPAELEAELSALAPHLRAVTRGR